MLTRREFIKLCIAGIAAMSLSDLIIPELARAFQTPGGRPMVIWLEAMTCAGDFMSFLNALRPDLQELLFKTIDLRYSNTLMTGEGRVAITELESIAGRRRGEYILIVEGTVPTMDGGTYGLIGHHPDGRPFTHLEAVRLLGGGARHLISAGTCASFGGPYAANPNPSGSKPVSAVLERRLVRERLVNVPGCPIHPDWLVGTLSHLLLYGIPDMDEHRRPRLFYGSLIHDRCPRRQHFDDGEFAAQPGDKECLYTIGCKGPVTFADCPVRKWNSGHMNWPVGANTPCIGCVSPGFPDRTSPFFAHLPDIHIPGVKRTADKIGTAVGVAAAAGIGAHAVASAITGRLSKNLMEGTEGKPAAISGAARAAVPQKPPGGAGGAGDASADAPGSSPGPGPGHAPGRVPRGIRGILRRLLARVRIKRGETRR
ncbi:MAG: hydrogenase small subunit [Firmicutes bacterium]|nr:hydrogenase small subunit [Bacillota bacterium]